MDATATRVQAFCQTWVPVYSGRRSFLFLLPETGSLSHCLYSSVDKSRHDTSLAKSGRTCRSTPYLHPGNLPVQSICSAAEHMAAASVLHSDIVIGPDVAPVCAGVLRRVSAGVLYDLSSAAGPTIEQYNQFIDDMPSTIARVGGYAVSTAGSANKLPGKIGHEQMRQQVARCVVAGFRLVYLGIVGVDLAWREAPQYVRERSCANRIDGTCTPECERAGHVEPDHSLGTPLPDRTYSLLLWVTVRREYYVAPKAANDVATQQLSHRLQQEAEACTLNVGDQRGRRLYNFVTGGDVSGLGQMVLDESMSGDQAYVCVRIPRLVGSRGCITTVTRARSAPAVPTGLDPNDTGGYFYMTGNKYVPRMVQMPRVNTIFALAGDKPPRFVTIPSHMRYGNQDTSAMTVDVDTAALDRLSPTDVVFYRRWAEVPLPGVSLAAQMYARPLDRDPLVVDRTSVSTLHPRMEWFAAECMRRDQAKMFRPEAVLWYSSGGFSNPFPVALAFMAFGVTATAALERIIGLTSATVDDLTLGPDLPSDSTHAARRAASSVGLRAPCLAGRSLVCLFVAVLLAPIGDSITMSALQETFDQARLADALIALVHECLLGLHDWAAVAPVYRAHCEVMCQSERAHRETADMLGLCADDDSDDARDTVRSEIERTLQEPLVVLIRELTASARGSPPAELYTALSSRWAIASRCLNVCAPETNVSRYTGLAMVDTTVAMALAACAPHVHRLMDRGLGEHNARMIAARALLVMMTRRTLMEEEKFRSNTSTLQRLLAMDADKLIASAQGVEERTLSVLLCHIRSGETEYKLATLHDMCMRVVAMATGNLEPNYAESEETKQVLHIGNAFSHLLLTGLRHDLSQAVQSINADLPKYKYDIARALYCTGMYTPRWSANRATNAFVAFMRRQTLYVGRTVYSGLLQIVMPSARKPIDSELRLVVLPVNERATARAERALDPTHYGFYDPIHQPDGMKTGLKRRLGCAVSVSPQLADSERDDLVRYLFACQPLDPITGSRYPLIISVRAIHSLAGETGASFLVRVTGMQTDSAGRAGSTRAVLRMLLNQLDESGDGEFNRMAQVMSDGSMMRVLLDGTCIGFACHPDTIVQVVDAWKSRSWDRRGVVAYYDQLRATVVISTDEGRLIRALFCVQPSRQENVYAIRVLALHECLARASAREITAIKARAAYEAGTIVFVDTGRAAEGRLLIGRRFDSPAFAATDCGGGADVRRVPSACELDDLAVLGTVSLASPRLNSTTAPRLIFQSGMDVQTMGPRLLHELPDTVQRISHQLVTWQRSLVTSRGDLQGGEVYAPRGNLYMTIINTHGSWGAEDAGVINRSAAERGLGNYKTTVQVSMEDVHKPSANRMMAPVSRGARPIDAPFTPDEVRALEHHMAGDVIYAGPLSLKYPLVKPDKRSGDKGEDARLLAHIDDDGIVSVGTAVKQGDIIGRRILFVEDIYADERKEKKAREETGGVPLVVTIEYERFKHPLRAVVTKVTSVHTPGSGARRFIVTFEHTTEPHIGTKLARQHSQKSIVSLTLCQADMPYVRSHDEALDGIVPDAMMNPHQLWRMTMSLVETGVMSMRAIDRGESANGTSFRPSGFDTAYLPDIPDPADASLVTADEVDCETMLCRPRQPKRPLPPQYADPIDPNDNLLEALEQVGKERHSEVVLVNGTTGQPMQGRSFLCCMYTTPLTHIPELKMAARARAIRSLQTGQPLGGKIAGGQRVGWQEFSAMISHGAAFTIRDWSSKLSDGRHYPACTRCGSFAYYDSNRKTGTNADVVCVWCDRVGGTPGDGSNIVWVNIPQSMHLLLSECAAMGISCKLRFTPDKKQAEYMFPGADAFRADSDSDTGPDNEPGASTARKSARPSGKARRASRVRERSNNRTAHKERKGAPSAVPSHDQKQAAQAQASSASRPSPPGSDDDDEPREDGNADSDRECADEAEALFAGSDGEDGDESSDASMDLGE